MVDLREMSNEQRRQLIDAQQAFEAWRAADQEFRHSYQGTMRWHKVCGREYLYRFTGGRAQVRKSLGRRSPETEKIKDDYVAARRRLQQRRKRLSDQLKTMAPVNRALRLNRVPPMETRIIRALDKQRLMGTQLHIVGTNALYAYEMKAGVFFGSGLLATRDVDLLWDARQRLRFVMTAEIERGGVLGILRQIDDSFALLHKGGFRASNDDGYLVDLIKPEENLLQPAEKKALGDDGEDLVGVGIAGLEWLINSPKLKETVIGSDGIPLFMSCVDPRVFALHKFWVSHRDDRQAQSRMRDLEQAIAVASVCQTHLRLPFITKELSALPQLLRDQRNELSKLVAERFAD